MKDVSSPLMIVHGPFKLISRTDGTVVLEVDVPGDGKGAMTVEVPGAHAPAFLHFMRAASSAAQTLSPPAVQ